MNDIFKFTLLPIFNFDVKFEELKKVNKSIAEVLNKESAISNKMISIQLFENYFKMKTLEEFLHDNHHNFSTLHWKVLSFQILYALYKITKIYPTFRHNKLDANSIYLYIRNETSKSVKIKIGEYNFNIPYMGFEIKITNFYDSNIISIADNKNTKLKQENQYYDVHYNI